MKTLTLKVTPAMLAALKTLAKQQGLGTVSQYVRDLILARLRQRTLPKMIAKRLRAQKLMPRKRARS
jgi:hypothetical protein